MERINPLQPRSVLPKGEPVGYHSPISHDPTPIFLEQRSNYLGSSHRIRQSRDDARDDYLPKAYGMERETQVHPPIRNHIMVSRSFTTTNRIHHDHEQQSHAARRDSWEAWRKSWHSWRSEGRRYFDDRTREPRPVGGMVPLSNKRASVRVDGTVSFRSQNQQQHEHGSQDSPIVFPAASHQAPPVSHAGYQRAMTKSQIVIPDTIHIPNALKHTDPPNPSLSSKRSLDYREPNHISSNEKRAKVKDTTLESTDDKKFSRLALLCSATIELGPLQENPTGCSCPKSRCIALYCDCFKAGRRCDRSVCTCLNCKNTAAESGPTGARSKAIQAILARNPRAFTNPGGAASVNKPAPGETACNCVRSQCLKLYCTCFQRRRPCNPDVCSCVRCLNTLTDTGGYRSAAIQAMLEKRPDAFDEPKAKEVGAGCACKNNQCIRKYCECFRNQLTCTDKCSCRNCKNGKL